MKKNNPIVITGGFGFIGSNLIEFLNKKGITPFIIESGMNNSKWKNSIGLKYILIAEEDIPENSIVIHLGANVDTTEPMNPNLWDNNVKYTKRLLALLMGKKLSKFIYASSAATYGAEEKDFSERIEGLKPLNAYGFTKWELDNFFQNAGYFSLQINAGKSVIPFYGLRFFNVYGPREGQKGNMASVIHKGLTKQEPIYREWTTHGFSMPPEWNLFKSHREGIKDGEQRRDLVYVEDVCRMIDFFITNTPENGIYNVGSGRATSFNEVVKAIDSNLNIKYVDMPDNLRNQYQYYTCANLDKLIKAGFDTKGMHGIVEGVEKTRKYLENNP